MFGASKNIPVTAVSRTFERSISGKGHVHLSNRRVMRKIKMGKARPAIFYQFDTLVELSDGSVIKRRSQAPKDEIRMITDQRNSELWNPNRSDLFTGDLSTGKVSKFKQRYAAFETEPEEKAEAEIPNKDNDGKVDAVKEKKVDELLELMGHNAQEVKGGVLFDKKKNRRR